MRVAFVCAEDEIPGLGYLSSHLKNHGHTVSLVFEPKQFDRAYIRSSFLAKVLSREKDNLLRLEEIKPDLIGFTCTTSHYQWAINFARKVKEKLPAVPIVFGGVHPTLLPELVLPESCVDFVCVGEGEQPLLELLRALERGDQEFSIFNIWYKRGGELVKNPLRPLLDDLDKLPYIDKELFRGFLPDHYFSHAFFFTSRGCPYNCNFCGNEGMRKVYAGLGRYVRRMSPERAVAELTLLKEKHGAKYILFEDDIFAIDVPWLQKFVPLYKEKVNLPFTCFGHVQTLTEEIIELLKAGGCELMWFGIQSANEKIRREVFGRFETNEKIVAAADLCHRYGIKFMVDHILNIPYDTLEAIKEAVLLYSRIRPAMINCYNLLYFPRAKINEIALQAGLIKEADIELINQGKGRAYQTGELLAHQQDFYTRYALLLTSVPLLPRWLTSRIATSERAIDLFGSLPLFFIPLVKIVLDFRAGRGFLPLAILRMELFFTRQFITSRLKRLLMREAVARV